MAGGTYKHRAHDTLVFMTSRPIICKMPQNAPVLAVADATIEVTLSAWRIGIPNYVYGIDSYISYNRYA